MGDYKSSRQYQKFYFNTEDKFHQAVREIERDLLKKIDKFCEVKQYHL